MMSFAKLASLLTIDVLLQALSILVAADPTQTESKIMLFLQTFKLMLSLIKQKPELFVVLE